jgi:hypothetical protein
LNPHAYDQSPGVFKGEKISRSDAARRKELAAIEAQRIRDWKLREERARIAKKENGVRNRLKGFFVGTTIGGKPHGSAILVKDLFARFKR